MRERFAREVEPNARDAEVEPLREGRQGAKPLLGRPHGNRGPPGVRPDDRPARATPRSLLCWWDASDGQALGTGMAGSARRRATPSPCPITDDARCSGSPAITTNPVNLLRDLGESYAHPDAVGAVVAPATRAGLPRRRQHARLAPRRATGAGVAAGPSPDGSPTRPLSRTPPRSPPGNRPLLSNLSCFSSGRQPPVRHAANPPACPKPATLVDRADFGRPESNRS